MPSEKKPAKPYAQATQLVHSGSFKTQFGETSDALFMNSGFCYDSAEIAESRFNGEAPGFVYSRYSNPNLAALEARLCELEGAEACNVMASGMAAVFASLMCQLKAGDRVVASRCLFSSCYYIINTILPRFGIEVELVDGADLKAWEKAFKKPAVCVFIETPSNPTLEVIDIAAVSKLAHKAGAKVILDNVFATPLYQRPLELGADIVVYSLTKHMDGQGRCLGGAVLGKADFMTDILLPFHRHTGPAISPFNAWVIHKSLETFALRMERHTDNAEKIAKFLDKRVGDKVKTVFYPHLISHPQYSVAKRQMTRGGGLVTFELEGGKKAAFRFMNALKLLTVSNNLGDARTLIAHPMTTTHASMTKEDRATLGIYDGMLRISAGLEAIEDLLGDIEQALKAV